MHNLCSVKCVKENKQPSKAPGGLEILHLNIRSLKNRAHLLELRQLASERKSGIITISETWLNTTITSAEIQIEGYKLHRLDRLHKGGGRSRCLCPQRSQIICTEGVVIDIRAKFPSALDKCPVQETKINYNLRYISPRRLSSEFLRRST